ncbi:MAG TPA: GNAT family N-acetyltransferase [Solirubrobacterales bacterium]|nr:GNAT family N-acetyltransferase [Solirubrobacterales bacterium]
MEVRELDPLADPRWDAYVEGHELASSFHLGAWSAILGGAYGVRPIYLAAEDDSGRLCGVLPLVRRRALFGGVRHSSLPLVRRAGPLADSDAALSLLLGAAERRARESGVPLVIRSSAPNLADLLGDGAAAVPQLPSWVLDVDRDLDEVRRGWPGNLRRDVSRGEREVTVREGDGEADLRDFYSLYLGTMRMHGVAPRPWREIALAWRLLAPERRLRLLLAERSGVVIGAAIALITGRRAELRYLTSAQSGLRHRPNHALYWSVIRMAADEGCTAIDFGNGSGSLVFFKRRWGCESEGLYRYVLGPGLGAGQPAPRLDTDPSDGGEPKTAAVWRRLPPPLARLGGALVYRYL